MSRLRKGILLAGLHLLLLLSLGGKLLLDRATRPRMWLKAAPVDPDLPIRGRYVNLRVEVPILQQDWESSTQRSQVRNWEHGFPWTTVNLKFNGDQVKAVPDPTGQSSLRVMPRVVLANTPEAREPWPKSKIELADPLAFFIPEHVPDPSRRAPGEELWVEVTLPKKGPLRPIRLAVKKGGTFTPLKL